MSAPCNAAIASLQGVNCMLDSVREVEVVIVHVDDHVSAAEFVGKIALGAKG